MSITVTIGKLIETNQPLVQLGNAPLPPKAKYWIGRIATAAHAHLMEYEKQRVALIKEIGQPVRQEPQPSIEIDGVMTPQPPKEIPVTDPKEISKPTTFYSVSDDAKDEFFKRLDVLQAEEVEIKFNTIKLDALGDSPIQVNLAALAWVIDEA